MPADVTVLRGDRARPGPQRRLVHTLLGQLLVLTLGASSLPSLCCRFLLPVMRMKSSPRDVPENHMESCITFLVLTRYQVLDLQLGCMKKKREIPGTVSRVQFREQRPWCLLAAHTLSTTVLAFPLLPSASPLWLTLIL